jgi:Arc/MetJ-type ribon-helix-helix transcriptional regulator
LLNGEIKRIDVELETARRQAKNLVNDVKAGNSSEWVRKALNELEADIGRLEAERDEAEQTCLSEVKLPTADELKRLFRDSFRDLAANSFTFARKFRRLVPRIVVFPVRLCDGGKIELRAKFRLQLATLITASAVRAKLAPTLEREIEVDAFELPQREQFRTQSVAMRAAGITERIISGKLGLTITATQAAAALQRLMDAIGISTPYVMITSPPEDYPKLSRHKHSRFEFKPLGDAGQL